MFPPQPPQCFNQHSLPRATVLSGRDIPLCGECAVLFYDKAPHAFWLAELDVNAIMSSQIQYMAELEDEMEELLQEIDQARQESEDGW
ncbi:hypothetical protein E5D57_007077 [Metarhizium anisopliae]|nr:hypothetical protein E5D57_007077 [Metarhizium anisopliae]